MRFPCSPGDRFMGGFPENMYIRLHISCFSLFFLLYSRRETWIVWIPPISFPVSAFLELISWAGNTEIQNPAYRTGKTTRPCFCGHLTISHFSARIALHQESGCLVSGQNSWNPCIWLKTPHVRDYGFHQNDAWVKNWLLLTVILTAGSQVICFIGGSLHPSSSNTPDLSVKTRKIGLCSFDSATVPYDKGLKIC